MKNCYLGLTTILLLLGGASPNPAFAQYIPIGAGISLIHAIAADNAADRALEARMTSTVTYHGVQFIMKRTPEEILTGDATDRIRQLEAQLALSYTALLADSTSRTCPAERQATIRKTIEYISLNRPDWKLKAYRQELRFYQNQDKSRGRASKSGS